MKLLDNTGRPYVKVEYDDWGNFQSGLREDGLWDIPLELTDEEIAILNLEAEKQGIDLNDFLVEIITEAIGYEKEKAAKVSGTP